MRDTNLVSALRLKCGGGKKMERDVIGAMRTAFEQSADRIVAAEEYALVLKKEIEKLRAQLRHLEGLAKADKDGRLVVLPCKVGDTLFRVFAGEILEHKVRNMRYFAIQGRWDIDTTPFCSYVESSIGKTIFLTREEADRALEAMKDD